MILNIFNICSTENENHIPYEVYRDLVSYEIIFYQYFINCINWCWRSGNVCSFGYNLRMGQILHLLNYSTNIAFYFFTPSFGLVLVYAPFHSNIVTIRRSFLYASSKFVFSSSSLLHSTVVVFYDNLLFFGLRSTYRSLL